MILVARTCQNGGRSGWSLHGSQAVYAPFCSTVMSPFDRSIARRAEARLVGGQSLDAVDESVAKIVAELEPAAVDDVAVLVRHLGMAFGVDPLGRPAVNNAVGLKHAALIEELDRALGRDRVLVLVVDELVGVDDQLVLGSALRPETFGPAGSAPPPGATRPKEPAQRDASANAARTRVASVAVAPGGDWAQGKS